MNEINNKGACWFGEIGLCLQTESCIGKSTANQVAAHIFTTIHEAFLRHVTDLIRSEANLIVDNDIGVYWLGELWCASITNFLPTCAVFILRLSPAQFHPISTEYVCAYYTACMKSSNLDRCCFKNQSSPPFRLKWWMDNALATPLMT